MTTQQAFSYFTSDRGSAKETRPATFAYFLPTRIFLVSNNVARKETIRIKTYNISEDRVGAPRRCCETPSFTALRHVSERCLLPDAPLQNLNNTVPFACDPSDWSNRRERERDSIHFSKRNSWSRTRRGAVGSRLEACQSGFKLDTNTR